jgi:multisubunit Na+/H+ antiporter MnhE subunit
MRKSIGLLFLVAFMISLVGSAVAFAGKVVDPTAKRRPAVPAVQMTKKMNATTTSIPTTPTINVIQ